MQRVGQRRGLRVPALLAVANLALVLTGSATVVHRSLPAPVAITAAAESVPEPQAVLAPEQRVPHSRLRSPAAKTRSASLVLRQPLLPLGIDRKGVLEVPSRAQDIGRWRDGPLPGDVGPAVLVGHVDLGGRPGVFVGLTRLGRGDLVDVQRPDGRVVRFRVTRTLRFSKEAFPTDAVYEPTDRAELRLVTCGGTFNRLTGHYRDNVVVFATVA